MTTVGTLILASAAFADELRVDGDSLAPLGSTLAFGSVECGVAKVADARLTVERTTNGSPNIFKDGSTATIIVLSTTGSGLSATVPAAPANQITFPDGWQATDNNVGATTGLVSASVTINSSTPGAGSGTVTFRATGTSANNNVMTRDATLNVTWTTGPCAPANTAPQVSVTGVADGASYEIGGVPTAMCDVVDAEDGNSSFPALLSAISGPLAGFGLGSQTASCSYTDGGGLTATASATYSIVDTTDPEITLLSRTPAANSNGWNNSDVTVTWTCTDAGSGAVAATVSETVSTEGANQSATGTCEDNAGNTASDTVGGISIDKTAPTASATASPAANANGWNNTDVTVSFSGSDSLSGIDFCSDSATLSAEGAGQSASGTCTDKAGNVSTTATASNISIDKTAPSVSLIGGPADGSSHYFGEVPAAPLCSASDALSGIDGSCTVVGYGTAVGTHTVMASAQDRAGNSASASATYNVLAWTLTGFYRPVDPSGTINVVKGGSTVPLKFEVFAGPTELTSTSVVKSFTMTSYDCSTLSFMMTDDIEEYTSGNTALRYDSTEGQFIQNWKVPKGANSCYLVKMTTQDGSFLTAVFKTK